MTCVVSLLSDRLGVTCGVSRLAAVHEKLFIDLPQMWIASSSLGVIEVLTLVFRRPSFSNARTVLEVDHVVFIHKYIIIYMCVYICIIIYTYIYKYIYLKIYQIQYHFKSTKSQAILGPLTITDLDGSPHSLQLFGDQIHDQVLGPSIKNDLG